MRWLFFVALACLMGIAISMQLAMLSALGEDFGIVEGAWISNLLTMGGVALLLALRGAAGGGEARLAARCTGPGRISSWASSRWSATASR